MRLPLLALVAVLTTPAIAADETAPRIVVSGTASVSTPPDRVSIGYSLHGEGTTSDEAVEAMVAKRKAVEGGLASFGGKPEARATSVAIAEVRGRDCTRNGNFQPKLSTGDCAIVGYTADIQMQLRTAAVKDAGTIVGLIGKLGGTNPRIERFYLAEGNGAEARALAAALANAKVQAEALAAGAHVSLGRIVAISNGSFGQQTMADIVVTANAVAAPPPPPPPPPVVISLTPQPIDTQAQVQVIYAIGS